MKSIYKPEYFLFCTLLREARLKAGLSQVALAAALGVPQAYVSAFELGKVRQDFVQIRDWCAACGLTVAQLANSFDTRWAAKQVVVTKKAAAPAKGPSKPAAKKAPAPAKRASKTPAKKR